MNGILLKKLWRLRKSNCADEIINAAEQHGNKTLARLIRNNTYDQKKLVKGMLPLILELHNAEYTQVIASNIYWPTQ